MLGSVWLLLVDPPHVAEAQVAHLLPGEGLDALALAAVVAQARAGLLHVAGQQALAAALGPARLPVPNPTPAQLDALLREVSTSDAAVMQMLSDLASKEGVVSFDAELPEPQKPMHTCPECGYAFT